MVTLVYQTGPAAFGETEPMECWLLNGVNYRQGKTLLSQDDWTWLKGPQGGAWETRDATVAQVLIERGIPVVNI